MAALRATAPARGTPASPAHALPRAAPVQAAHPRWVTPSQGSPRGSDFSQMPPVARSPVALQAKLSVGARADRFEQEADSLADQVMGMGEMAALVTRLPAQLSRACDDCERDERKLRRRSTGQIGPQGGEAPDSVHAALRSPGTALDAPTRGFFENRFGHDFSAVQIHTGSLAAASAVAVGARAYTVGADIVFAEGQYAPHSRQGRHLLAHELAHVLQQGQAAALPGADRHPVAAAPPRLQRVYTDDHAAGCGVCEPPQMSGIRAHQLVQQSFAGLRRRTVREVQAEVGISYPESPSNGILDLVRIIRSPTPPFETRVEIGEIKAHNDNGILTGHNDLRNYMFELDHSQVIAGISRAQLVFDFLDLAPPQRTMSFKDPTTPCAAQTLTVEPPDDGLYLYSCTPLRRTMPKQCCEEEEERQRARRQAKRARSSGDQKQDDQQKDKPQTLQGPVATGEPGATPETEKQPEPNQQPIPIRPKPGKQDAPEHEPMPIAARDLWHEALQFFLVAGLAAGAIALVRRLATAASKTRGGGPLVVLEAIAAVAVLVLGEREAKAGTRHTDDDPLVALAQVLGDSGRPMPPEIEALLRNNPELRELIRLEMERRRRAGAKPGQGTTAGAQPGKGTAPGKATAPAPPAGTAPPGSTAAPAPKPAEGEAGTSASADEPVRPQPIGEPGPGYWANLQTVLESAEAKAVPTGKAQFLWPRGTGPKTAAPGQSVSGIYIGHDAKRQRRYAFQLEIQVLGRQPGATLVKVAWSGPILIEGGAKLPGAPGYAPGRTLPIKDAGE